MKSLKALHQCNKNDHCRHYGRLGLILSWITPKTQKMVSAAFSCFNAQHLRVAQRIKKQSTDYTYTSAKVKISSVLAL